MLILSRKTDESIVIGEDIEIRVTRIEGDLVKIGISAPRSIAVYRKELLDSVEASNQDAARRGRGPEDRIKLPAGLLSRKKKSTQTHSASEDSGVRPPALSRKEA